MKIATINKLCCPFDHSDLTLTRVSEDTEGKILEGWLHCPHCTRIYPIVKGIPIMSPDAYREMDMEKPLFEKWQKNPRGQEGKGFQVN